MSLNIKDMCENTDMGISMILFLEKDLTDLRISMILFLEKDLNNSFFIYLCLSK
jgi:hypothetical protein